jgi:hypothetical protein
MNRFLAYSLPLTLAATSIVACGSKNDSSASGTDAIVGDASVASEASGQSQHFTNDVLNAIQPTSKTADAAGGDVAAPTVKLWPASCVTREKDANACDANSCLVHITFNDCTGPFGLVHIDGGEDVTITTSGGGLDAKWTSVNLTWNGHPITHTADAKITLNADGTRNVGWTGHWDRDREDGTHVTHDGSYTIVVDPAAHTRTVNGTESTVHETRSITGTVKNLVEKWDAAFVEDCPSGEIDYASSGGKTASIVFDGSATAVVTGPNGGVYHVPLVCPAQ